MNKRRTIMIVDDEKSIRDTLKILFEDENYNVFTAKNSIEALSIIDNNYIEVVVTDLRMPEIDGVELLKRIKKIDKNIQVIFISAYNDTSSVVRAMKLGAYDYVQKSFANEEILLSIERAIENLDLIKENIILKRQLQKNYNQSGVIGKNQKMQNIFSLIDRISKTKAKILLIGESGVGKEVLAKLIHSKSDRKDKKFIVINCGAIPENLIESELFGYEKGSFTGADRTKLGKFEQADGGTVFIDEIGELPLNMQVRFLRVLQENQIERIGSNKSKKINIRIIAATNKDLNKEVDNGNFRRDLYYRLNVIQIKIPPLRERKEDIPLLAEKFIGDFSKDYQKKIKLIDLEVLNYFIVNEWKGNVRELKNVIERAIAIADPEEEILSKHHLDYGTNLYSNSNKNIKFCTLKEFEKIAIQTTLKSVDNNKTKAAKLLDINRQTLYNKINEYEIEK